MLKNIVLTLKNLLVYGMMERKNITETFDACFSEANYLLCDLHIEDNISISFRN